MKTNAKGSILLILCAFIWGTAFSAQSTAMEYVGPFTFVFLRSLITSLVLFAGYPLFKSLGGCLVNRQNLKRHLKIGVLLGVIMAVSTSLQQMGIVYTTTAKSGFITALYIVIIPILGIFMGRRTGGRVWLGVAISLLGLCLLCLKSDLSINIGDVLTLGCAVVYAFHIITIDLYAGELNAIFLSAIQFAVAAVIAAVAMLGLETPTFSAMLSCWTSILYVAVFSGAIGYTLQIIGQKYTEPTLASLLMCLESVFAAIGGWVLLGQSLTPKEILGCVLMLAASIIAQLPKRARKAAVQE